MSKNFSKLRSEMYENMSQRLSAENKRLSFELEYAWARYKNANALSVSFQLERADLVQENFKLKDRIQELEVRLNKLSHVDVLARINTEPGYAMSLLKSAGILDSSGNLAPSYKED